jgi:pimeloyl-ACP methyl ester carboxylesterase
VVLCNPVNDDIIRAHRTLRHLAERLAAAGFPVLRFDFHGTGDSSGDERDPDAVATWLDDVGRAVAELRARSGVNGVALVGLRLGATLAAEAAARAGGVDSVVLWGAYESGSAFVSETTRMHKMHKMLEPDSFAAGPKVYPDGEEALGFFLTKETVASLAKLDLRALKTRPAPHALVIDAANTPVALRTVDHLKSLGADVTHRHMPGHKFLMSVPHRSVVPTEILDTIISWLEERYPASTATSTTPARASDANAVAHPGRVALSRNDGRNGGGSGAVRTVDEVPVAFGSAQRLFGILTKPAESDRRATRPCVILLNAGTAHRIGPHRSSVKMARAWADRGFFVLRMDLSGIGDSLVAPSAPGGEENVAYPKSGLDDCKAAMTFLRGEIGTTKFVVAGLCSGADTSFQLAVRDDRVVGVVMMNPQTFYVHDLSNIQAYKDGRYYQDSFFRKESWMKLARGDVDVKRVAKMIAPKVKLEAVSRMKRLIGRVRPSEGDQRMDERPDVPGWIRSMAERGVETLLVATVHDAGVEFADAFYGKRMRGLDGLPKYRRVDVEGTDNTFTSVYAQEHVARTITEHLVSRHSS